MRPHLIWGPRDNHLIPRLIRRAGVGKLRRVGEGRNLISISYVENVAYAHLLAADALSPEAPLAGRAYFINEPEPVNLWEWLDDLLDRAGLPPLKKSISAKAAWRLGAMLEAIDAAREAARRGRLVIASCQKSDDLSQRENGSGALQQPADCLERPIACVPAAKKSK